MIAVYPVKRRGLPARVCYGCSKTRGKMLELQAGDSQNKTTLVLCETCAGVVARQIFMGGIRRPKRKAIGE